MSSRWETVQPYGTRFFFKKIHKKFVEKEKVVTFAARFKIEAPRSLKIPSVGPAVPVRRKAPIVPLGGLRGLEFSKIADL